jgi:hypothetical protein
MAPDGASLSRYRYKGINLLTGYDKVDKYYAC